MGLGDLARVLGTGEERMSFGFIHVFFPRKLG